MSGEKRPARAGGGGGHEDVHLGADWIARWVPALDGNEVRAYLYLAREARKRVYHEPAELRPVFGDRPDAEIEKRIEALEKKGLIEIVRARGKLHYHLRHVGADGIHRAEPARPSIKEALESHRAMMDELLQVAALDETDALRDKMFAKYPALREEWSASQENSTPDSPPWRMWMELALHLLGRFEERYGGLHAEHAELFKEASAQALRLKLEIIDRLTRDILERRADVFPARGQSWIASLPESAFVSLPLVRELARKYRVGAEQIYLNALEALQAEGLSVVELDERGRATDLALPSTTGLTRDDERLVFLNVEEMTSAEVEHLDDTLKKIREAKRRHARHLVECGARALVDLARKDRLSDPESMFQLLTDRVNEALDLIRDEGDDARTAPPLVTIDDVIAAFDDVKKAGSKAAS